MSEPGTRPGGLTALAVINFVVSALYLFGGAALVLGAAFSTTHRAEMEAAQAAEESRAVARDSNASAEAQRERHDKHVMARTMIEHPGIAALDGAARGILGVLLIVSGVGYLKLRRGLGRVTGILYGIGAIGWHAVQASYIDKLLDRSFGISHLINFIYPAVTLLCLLFVFKDDFHS